MYLHESVWQRKSATSNLPIIVGEYQCKAWMDVDSMKEELAQYGFEKISIVAHYDPEHRIHGFYMKERKKAYEHRPLIEEEPYRNVSSEAKMKKIHVKVQEHVKKQHRQAEAAIKLKSLQLKGKKSQESTSKATQVPPSI